MLAPINVNGRIQPAFFYQSTAQFMNKRLKQFISNKEGKALDLGCGQLQDIKGLETLGWFCEGVDLPKVDLENYYLSQQAPFDLVYCNYVLHLIQNKKILIKSAYDNLKKDGWLFIHVFDKSDKNGDSSVTIPKMRLLLKDFQNITTKVFSLYDDDEGHRHWHKVIEATAQK